MRIFSSLVLIFVVSVFLSLLVPVSASAQYTTPGLGIGDKGWCTVTPSNSGIDGCGNASAQQACQLQMDLYSPSSKLLPITDVNNPNRSRCRWEGPTPNPAWVEKDCQPGYNNVYGVCQKDTYQEQPTSCSANPQTDNPINIISGAKTLTREDFRSGDGRMVVNRYYHSRPGGKRTGNIPELGKNWYLSTNLQVELYDFSGSRIRVHISVPNGGVHSFGVNDQGEFYPSNSSAKYNVFRPIGGIKNDWRVEIVSDWPGKAAFLDTENTLKLTNVDGAEYIVKTVKRNLESSEERRTMGLVQNAKFQGGYTQTYTYAADNRLLTIVDTYNRTISFGYTPVIWQFTNENGAVEEIRRSDGELEAPQIYAMSTVNFPDGSRMDFGYGAFDAFDLKWGVSRRLATAKRTAADGSVTQETYHYEDIRFPLALTGVTDARSVRNLTAAYNDNGQAVLSELAGGAERTTIVYDNADTPMLKRHVTNALGKTAIYHLEKVGKSTLNNSGASLVLRSIDGQASANCPASNSVINIPNWKTDGVVGFTDREGRETTYVRDDIGRVTSKTRAAGLPEEATTTTDWHEQYALPTHTVEPGLTTDYTYDGQGRLQSLTQTDTSGNASTPRIWSFTYTPDGLNIASIDGPLPGASDTQSFTYAAEKLTSITNEVGHVTQITRHSAIGLPEMLTDANGVTSEFDYDYMNRLSKITQDAGGTSPAVTQIFYDVVGNVTNVTPPNGASLIFRYDDAQRLIQIENSVLERIDYGRNAMGGIASTTISAPGGAIRHQLSQTLDELNRVIETVNAGNPVGSTSFSYDNEDNLVSAIDPRGGTWSQSIDGLNRIKSQTDAAGVTTDYDLAPQAGPRNPLLKVTDGRGATTNYIRNGFGEIVREVNLEVGITEYVRDERGLVTQMSDARGVVSTYSYDAAGRPLGVSYPSSPTEEIGYTWDTGAYGIGQLTRVSESFGDTIYSYNGLGQMVSMTRSISGTSYQTDYDYDLAGEVLFVTYPGGREVRYTRDLAARITAVETRVSGDAVWTMVMDQIGYTPFGPMSGAMFGDGHALNISYDQAYRATNLSRQHIGGVALMNVDFGYDGAGDILSLSDHVRPERSQNFGYDLVSRLTTANGSYGALAYDYNAGGDRTERTWTVDGVSDEENYAYNDNFQLESVTSSLGSVRQFAYEASGQISSDMRDGTLYNYTNTARGRMGAVHQDGALIANYTYDDDEQRVVKTLAGGDITHYHYDDQGRLISETNGANGESIRDYLWLGLTPIAVIAANDNAGPEVCDEERIGVLTGKITDKQGKIAVKTARIVTLTDKITAKLARITFKQGKIAAHETRIAELEAILAGVNPNNTDRIARLSAKITARRVKIMALSVQITVLEAKVNDHQAKTGEIEARILVLETRIIAHEAKLVDLQAECDSGGGDSAELYYLHADHLGRPQFATDSAGEIVWDMGGAVTPFGEGVNTAGAFTQNLMFPGQYADEESGLSHNHHRTYDPTLGRYLQSDPIGLAGGLNRYAYVGGNPMGAVDPTGEFGLVGALFGGVSNVITQLVLNGGRWECIDAADVLIATAIGAVVPGSLSSLKTIGKAFKKRKQLNGFLKKVKNTKNKQKFLRRRKKENRIIQKELSVRVGAASASTILRKTFNFYPNGTCGC